MKTLKLTDKQSALLERTLFGLLAGLERDASDPIALGDVELPRSKRECDILSRVWFSCAKLEGKA